MVTLLGLVVLLVIVARLLRGAEPVLWWLSPLFLLWGNLHGGFVAGLFLLGLVSGLSLTMRLVVARWPGLEQRLDERPLSWPQLQRLMLATVAAALVTLLNPYRWRLHAEIVESLSDRFMRDTLREWQPVTLATLAGRRYAIYLAALGVAAVLWYRKIEPVRLGVLAVVGFLSLRHLRNIPLFLIVSLPFAAELTASGLGRAGLVLLKTPVRPRAALFGVTMATAVLLVWLGPGHLNRVAWSVLDPEAFFRHLLSGRGRGLDETAAAAQGLPPLQ